MRKRILAYIKYMNELLDRFEAEQKAKKDSGEPEEVDEIRVKLEKIKTEHLTQIAFFQHERLILRISGVLVMAHMSISFCPVQFPPRLI